MNALDAARRAVREHGDYTLLGTQIPYSRFLGVEVQNQAGRMRFRLPFRKSLVGNAVLQALHGGVVAGFMENAALLQLLLALDARRIPKIIGFSVDYLRSANAVDTFASCDVTRQGRRVAQVQIRCWQDAAGTAPEERIVALGRAMFLLAAAE